MPYYRLSNLPNLHSIFDSHERVIDCFRWMFSLNAAVLLFALRRLNENGVDVVVVVLKYWPKLAKSYGFFVVDATRFR